MLCVCSHQMEVQVRQPQSIWAAENREASIKINWYAFQHLLVFKRWQDLHRVFPSELVKVIACMCNSRMLKKNDVNNAICLWKTVLFAHARYGLWYIIIKRYVSIMLYFPDVNFVRRCLAFSLCDKDAAQAKKIWIHLSCGENAWVCTN